MRIGECAVRGIKSAFWLLLALAVPVAHAQEADPNIVVEGQKAITTKEARKFVQTVTSEINGQFARFDAPACPLVIGLSRRVAEPIEARIRDVARAVGAPVAKGKCAANIFLVATDNADQWVKRFMKRYPAPFEDMWSGERRPLSEPGRVHAWRVVELQNENGVPTGCNPGEMCVLQVQSASHINMPVKQVTLNAVVVIEQELLYDHTAVQVGDNVAMRALAGGRPGDVQGAETILTLFDTGGAAAAPELSALDFELLHGLYRVRQNSTAHRQANDIATGISRALARENDKRD